MDRKSFIKSCHRKGYTYTKIAFFLGVSRQRIDQILHPNKLTARRLVREAELKSKACEYHDCGLLKTEAHHFDYNKPLEVTWLCIKHHREFHRKLRFKKQPKKCVRCFKELGKRGKKWCEDCSRLVQNKRRRIAFKTNPIYKANQIKATLRWRKNNLEKNKKIVRRAVKKYYGKNRDNILLKAKARYASDPEYRERLMLSQKKYQEKIKRKF